METAQRIFVEVGYQGATVRKIAKEVGVSSTAIYMHFPDKRAMLLEIAAEAMSQLLGHAREIAAEPVDAAVRARRMMLAHMRFALDNRSAYVVVFGEAHAEIKEGGAHSLGGEYYRCFAAVIAELAKEGRLRLQHPHAVAQTMWAGCHGLVSLLIANPDFGWLPADELTEAMTDTLMVGALKS